MGTSGSKRTIAVIGSGHIGTALVEGLIRFAKIDPSHLIVSNPSGSGLRLIRKRFGVNTTTDNRIATEASDWVILAVKPNVVQSVIREIRDLLDGKVLISLAAIIRLSLIRQWARPYRPTCIRIMPNIPVAVGKGVIGFFADALVAKDTKTALVNVLKSLGIVIDVRRREGVLDELTIIGGCGPALVASSLHDIAAYGHDHRLSLHQSRNIAMHLFKGTIQYMEQRHIHPEQLVASVATKGGITETILHSLRRHKIQKRFSKSLDDGLAKLKHQCSTCS